MFHDFRARRCCYTMNTQLLFQVVRVRTAHWVVSKRTVGRRCRALRTLPSRPPNLPQPLSSFIGRGEEIRAVCKLFMSGARLVTLTGPGGVGKTRLALTVAGKLSAGFDGEVVFVSLAPIADHELVMPTVARALGVEEATDAPVLDRLATDLQGRRVAIVLDNVEHVLGAAPEVSSLLQACPELIVLATGREPLRLQGEHEYAVRPLAVRRDASGVTEPGERESDAVQLFVERAQQSSHEFALTDESRVVVEEICRRLDGVPLALELAAAQLKVFSPDDLLSRLDQPLAVLTGGPRDLPDRQQTMRATLQWSYDLLATDEQHLFRRLSVFSGGGSLDAIEAVSPDRAVLENLASLISKGLVRRVSNLDNPARYDMLEPVRQFSLECLDECSDEAQRARQLHTEYFLSLVEGLNRRLDGPDGPAWFKRIESVHANLRAVLRRLQARDQVEPGLKLVSELAIFWHQHAHVSEGRRHAEFFLTAPGATRRTILRARALCFASWMWINTNEEQAALEMNAEACSIAEELGDRSMLAHALFVQGVCRFRKDEYELATLDWERALILFRELDDSSMEIRILTYLGTMARHQGNLMQSRAVLEEALSLARSSDLKVIIAHALGSLGSTVERLGDDRAAFDFYFERLILICELGDPRDIADSIERIANLARRGNKLDYAVCLLGVASVLRQQAGGLSYRVTVDGDIDRELSGLRAIVPDVEFRAAWDRGRRMALEDAVELAFQSREAVQDEHRPATPGGLTPRELEVLALMASGKSNSEMADELYLSIRTVERHVSNIYRKIDAHNRTDATRYALQHKIIALANT